MFGGSFCAHRERDDGSTADVEDVCVGYGIIEREMEEVNILDLV